jgi:hypothetical protein
MLDNPQYPLWPTKMLDPYPCPRNHVRHLEELFFTVSGLHEKKEMRDVQ